MKDNTKGTKKVSTKQLNIDFFAIDDTRMEKIDLSSFNFPGEIFAKTISMKDFQEISNKCTVLRQGVDIADAKPSDYQFSDDFVGYTIAASVCDSEGNLIFDYEDIPAIMEKSKAIFETVQTAVTKMNTAVTEEEVKEKEKK